MTAVRVSTYPFRSSGWLAALLELLSVTPGEAGEPDLVLGRLRAGSLPPGEYLLELRVGEDGVARAVTARPFLIAGPAR